MNSFKDKDYSEIEIYQAMKDYPDNIRRYKLLIDEINQVYNITANYGVEASQPKSKGSISDMVYQEFQRRLNIIKDNQTTVEKMQLIQSFYKTKQFTELPEREKQILNAFLDGESQTLISQVISISQPAINKCLRKIARWISMEQL